VLNAAPYFNEVGYEKQMGLPEGEKNSILYNENAFLLSCKSILHLLHRPLQVNNPLHDFKTKICNID
jgi:ubiquitin-conjugating enzyme E2 O